MARSETILGRKASRKAFHWAGRHRSFFTVSTFLTRQGKRFYTDPVQRSTWPRPSVLYRLHIYPKQEQFDGQH